ncbi:putative transmembrane protein [Sesbania bispinosa]|nr:putative transmembrane protein [Sesbania bispinosa]
MRNSKVRPIKLSNSSDNSLQVTPNLQLDHGTCSLRGREFWYARRAFLNSYHFNLERNNNGSFKEKLKKSVKEVNEAAMRVVLGMRQGMYKRRLGIRAYRVTMSLPSVFLVTIRPSSFSSFSSFSPFICARYAPSSSLFISVLP